MKLTPLLLAATLAANAALVVVYLNRSASPSLTASAANSKASSPNSKSSQTLSPSNGETPNPKSTASALAADGKAWSTLDSADLHALAARLRAAGFPPSIVRAVIGARVTASLRPRLQELLADTEEKPFWATERDFTGGLSAKTLAAMRESGRESTRLLRDALGDDPTAAAQNAGDYQIRRYGDLPREKIDQLQRVEEDYNELRNQVRAATNGVTLPEDREKLALLETEKRADLAKILSPQELEDFLVRSSTTTTRLRTALTAMNATEAEFRAIYQAQSAYDEKYNSPGLGITYSGSDQMKDRQADQARATEQIKLALGDQRFAEYTRNSDREFQTISRVAQQANLPATAAVQVYDLRENLSKESNRIFADTALTVDQKRTALQSLAQNTRAQITTTLGVDAGRSYLQVAANWLDRVERGGAVTFTPGGGTSSRSLPPSRPPGAAAPNPGAPVPATIIRGP